MCRGSHVAPLRLKTLSETYRHCRWVTCSVVHEPSGLESVGNRSLGGPNRGPGAASSLWAA